jgi:ADP-dependent NAD(P)H-hydrate dehydratase / NAD(P)H-hydrate epimerase
MPYTIKNSPSLWREHLPAPKPDSHKYDRGVAVIYGAPKMTGATRLAARACTRMGAGLVKVIAPEGTGIIYRSTLHEEIIVMDDETVLDDPRTTAVLFGPGWNDADGSVHMEIIKGSLAHDHIRAVVLDAGAFLAAKDLFSPKLIVTPHEGEFARAFPDLSGEKAERTRAAAERLGGVVVLKGPQTIVAAKGVAAVIVHDRPLPQLATGGTGDVLAGMITGLAAQGMDLRMAAAASVWIQGEAAARFGAGLLAGDLPDLVPAVLDDLNNV